MELKTEITQTVEPLKFSYCRLCLSAIEMSGLKDLFAPFNTSQSIAKTIENFARVEIFETDTYSKLICLKCFDKLEATEEFKLLIETSDRRLKKQLNTPNFDKDLLDADPLDVDVDLNSDITEEEEEESDEALDTNQDDQETKQTFLTSELYIKEEPLPSINDTETINCEMEGVKESGDDKKISDTELEKAEHKKVKKKRIRKKIIRQCPNCDKSFKSWDGLKAHSYKHSEQYRYFCSFCNKGFGRKGAHAAHEATHKDVTPYQCEVCGKGFKTASGLYSHRTTHEDSESFKCDQCPKSFKSKIRLSAHYIVHSTEFNYACEICDAAYRTLGAKNKHIKEKHTPKPQVPCHICSKLVPNLKKHMDTHTKPFICHFCDQSYAYRSLLRIHLNKHTKEKIYKCDICFKVLSTAKHLKDHQWIHEDKKRYQCELCGKEFNYKQNLDGHLQKAHPQGNGSS